MPRCRSSIHWILLTPGADFRGSRHSLFPTVSYTLAFQKDSILVLVGDETRIDAEGSRRTTGSEKEVAGSVLEFSPDDR